jgi:hypothetical protein
MKDAIRSNGGGWVPQVRVALVPHPNGGSQKPSTNPPQTKLTVTGKKEITTEKLSGTTVKVTEGLDSTITDETTKDSQEGPPKSVVCGLITGYDAVTPFDISVDPQYMVAVGKNALPKLKKSREGR